MSSILAHCMTDGPKPAQAAPKANRRVNTQRQIDGAGALRCARPPESSKSSTCSSPTVRADFGMESVQPTAATASSTGWGTINGPRTLSASRSELHRPFGDHIVKTHAQKINKRQTCDAPRRADCIRLQDQAARAFQQASPRCGYTSVFQNNIPRLCVIPQISVIKVPSAGGRVTLPALLTLFLWCATQAICPTGPGLSKL